MGAGGEALVFVYNADSGVFNALADLAHKMLSPRTYACNLCRLTYSPAGMRREWREFLQSLGLEIEFLHRDELRSTQGLEDLELPAVLRRRGQTLSPWIAAAELEACSSLGELEALLRRKLDEPEPG